MKNIFFGASLFLLFFCVGKKIIVQQEKYVHKSTTEYDIEYPTTWSIERENVSITKGTQFLVQIEAPKDFDRDTYLESVILQKGENNTKTLEQNAEETINNYKLLHKSDSLIVVSKEIKPGFIEYYLTYNNPINKKRMEDHFRFFAQKSNIFILSFSMEEGMREKYIPIEERIFKSFRLK